MMVMKSVLFINMLTVSNMVVSTYSNDEDKMNKMLMFLMMVIIMTTTMIMMMARMTTMKRMTRQCEWIWNDLFLAYNWDLFKHVFFSQGYSIHFWFHIISQTSSKCRPTSISQRSSSFTQGLTQDSTLPSEHWRKADAGISEPWLIRRNSFQTKSSKITGPNNGPKKPYV